jgi:multisubunit Na+/H+ antiporter MnhB subunit
VARSQAGRSRTASAILSAVSTTARSFGRALHQLWLEVTGLLFLAMALGFAGASFKEYGKYHASHVGTGRLAIAVVATVAFAWFGLSSFWRVRRKSQR